MLGEQAFGLVFFVAHVEEQNHALARLVDEEEGAGHRLEVARRNTEDVGNFNLCDGLVRLCHQVEVVKRDLVVRTHHEVKVIAEAEAVDQDLLGLGVRKF
jgi:hypothetical protein